MDNELLVKTIRTLCKDNNISVSQLESDLNFGAGLISRWTKSSPSLDKIIDIADYFNISIDEVVGRKDTISDDFLEVLYNKTVTKEIQWKPFNITEDESGLKQYHDNAEHDFYSKEEYDYYCETHKELSYYFEYMSGFISIHAMYEYHKVSAPYEINLFIQPDIQAELVPQQYNINELLPLWLKVLTSLNNNAPDEIKAADLKQQILSSTEEQFLLDNYSKYMNNFESNEIEVEKLVNDDKTKQLLTQVSTPEIKQLINMFTDPKMVQMVNSTQKLIKYFEEVKSEKENSNNNKRAGD